MEEKEAKAKAMDVRLLSKPQNMRLVLLGLLGIALILAGTFFTSEPRRTRKESRFQDDLRVHAAALEAAVEETLSSIRGVGKVMVSVTLESGPESVYAQNVTRSSTSQSELLESGAKRENATRNEASQPVTGRFGASDSPLVEKTLPAKIAGCLVVAEGASSSNVKASIYRAVQALLAIPIYKIEVAPMKGGR